MTDILKDSLHTISQWLLIPTMVILILLILVAAASIGGVLAEAVRERSVVRENVTKLILGIHGRNAEEIRAMVDASRIYTRHKDALYTILDNGNMPEELLVAAARRLIATEETRFEKRASLTEMASRVAPMFGLMGTLIPLGPGLLALGQGDTLSLADSLLVAFDTTVAGLITAAVCYVIAKIRRRWYDDYMVSLETLMNAVLEEVTSRQKDKLESEGISDVQTERESFVSAETESEKSEGGIPE